MIEKSKGRVGGASARFRSPLYHQIYLILRQRIADGEFGVDGLLPSEQELAAFHGVSRITTKRALDELAADNLVVRERGRGTRVARNSAAARISSPSIGPFDPLIAMGGETEAEVLEFGYSPAGRDVASALGVSPADSVQRAVRVRRTDGDTFSHLTTYLPVPIGRNFGADDLAETPILALLERAGATPTTAEQTVTATLADSVVATRLGVDIGAPLLRVRRIVRDRTDRAIELLVALYRTDLYRLTMTLTRACEHPIRGLWSTETVTGVSAEPAGTWRAAGTTDE